MALAVCLMFDRRGDLLVRNLWARLEEAGIRTLSSHTHGRHRPHLSYAVLLSWDLDRVFEALASLPDGGQFELSFQGAQVFPRGRVALAPAVPAEVALRQAAVADALVSTGAVLHRHYEPGHWVPHVSVATRAVADDLSTAVTAVSDTVPITARVERAAIVDSSTGELWPLPIVP